MSKTRPTIAELEEILAEPDGGTVEILPDGRAVVDKELTLLRERAEKAEARVAQLEAAIRGLVVDGYDKDGPYTRNCSACAACDIPYDFKHCEGCPAKPALDLVFGSHDNDHARVVERKEAE